MKHGNAALLLACCLASASPVRHGPLAAREVPHEHAQNHFLDIVRTSLNINNPLKIQDPVFGLLGNAAAAAGAGSVTNLDCLQQETADQAFTNAKAAGDIPGMAGALVYRALERNTGKVGLASVLCSETAKNPQIAAISQHQDPASAGAAATNKKIALELAKQLAAIGADPLLALESGTFAPGDVNDPTAKGNSCDTENDEPGCIFSERLLVLDVSVEEISSAVAGIKPTSSGTGVILATEICFAGLSIAGGGVQGAVAAAGAAAEPTAAAANAGCEAGSAAAAPTSTCSTVTTTVAANVATAMMAQMTNVAASPVAASGTNVQKFTGTLGGPAPPVTSSSGDRPFEVNGNTFVNIGAAIQRSCDIQHNACANAANGGKLAGGVDQCTKQQSDCEAANGNAKVKRAVDFGSCGNPTILFEAKHNGRNTEAFIAEDQKSFNHGSALNIAVIAGFICQRLGSSCNAPTAVQATCTSASAAAVATTQNQAAADVFNSILGVGGGAAAAVATPAAASPAPAQTSVVLTYTQCA